MILLLIAALFLAIFVYALWNWSYFLRKGIPGPLGLPGLGIMDQMLEHENPPLLKLKEWTKQYGPIWGFTEGSQKTIVISDPTMVHEVFVKQFDNFYGRKLRPIVGDPEKNVRIHMFAAQGKRWKRLRTFSSPSFSNNSLRKVKNTVQDCVTEIMGHIEQKATKGEDLDMLQFYQEYTIGVIGRIALNQTESQMFNNPLLAKVKAIFLGSRNSFLLTGIIPPSALLLRKLSTYLPSDFVPAFRIFELIEAAVNSRIQQRELDAQQGIEVGEPQDFIDLFLDARSDVDMFDETNEDFSKSQMGKVNRELTIDEIIGQCFVFLAAGFDTTSLSMSFATWLLATNPEVQKKCQEEVDRECPDPEVTFDQLSKLKYMDAVMKETLRLFPLGVGANTRKCMRETEVNGLRIEEGVYVQVDAYTLHHDKKTWGDDVEEFKPERWLTGSADQYEHTGAYVPFGSGPRQCIGMRLAQMEQKLLLSQILRLYTFRTTVSTQIPIKLVGALTVSPESVIVKLEPRDL